MVIKLTIGWNIANVGVKHQSINQSIALCIFSAVHTTSTTDNNNPRGATEDSTDMAATSKYIRKSD